MIDIKSINYILFSLGEQRLKRSKIAFINRGFLYGIFSFIWQFIVSFKNYGLWFPKFKGKGRVLFYGLTINNRLVLRKLIDNFKYESISIIDNKSHPRWLEYLFSLPYFFNLILVFCKSSRSERNIILNNFATFWRTYGMYHVANLIIKKYKLQIIVLANDHHPLNICFNLLSQKKGIETVYVQHASVTNKFPPLNFSYSFIDGEDSLIKYKSCGKLKGNIYLSGAVRFDDFRYCPIKNNNDFFVIGIAINSLDDISIVKQFSQTLSKEKIKEKEIKIILRPHPGYYGSELKDWCSINNIYFSDSHNESSSRFLEDINLLISNQSSIHLDSVIMRRPSFIYNFSNKEVIDWYDYLKNGLVEEIHSLEELLERLNSESTSLPQDELIQYYNTSYKKRFEGNVTKIVTSFLESLIDRRNHIFYESYITKVIEKGDNYNVMTII